jgi:phage gp29-like protein
MARAAAQVHADVLDTLVRQGRRSVVRMLYRDVLRQWIRVNWGDAAITLTPIPSLGVTEQRDLPAMMGAISQLWNAGYLHPSQQAGIDDDLNLPPRDLTAAPVPADPQAGPPQPAPGQAAQDAGRQGGQPGQGQPPADQKQEAA